MKTLELQPTEYTPSFVWKGSPFEMPEGMIWGRDHTFRPLHAIDSIEEYNHHGSTILRFRDGPIWVLDLDPMDFLKLVAKDYHHIEVAGYAVFPSGPHYDDF
jgi:hypothetical protein